MLPDLQLYPVERFGWTLDGWLSAAPRQKGWTVLFDSNSSTGRVIVDLAQNGTARVRLAAGPATAEWFTDPVCSARLAQGQRYLALILDNGPKMLSWVVDGHLCDGGPTGVAHAAGHPLPPGFPAGTFLFDPAIGDLGSAGAEATVGLRGRLYRRALYVSECIGNWRAGPAGDVAVVV